MKQWAVNWFEGMPLTPQHFQAADRYLHRQVDEAEDWVRPFSWGIRTLDLRVGHEEAVLVACEARFKDGAKLVVPGDFDEGELRLELGKILSVPNSRASLYLAMPIELKRRSILEMHPCEDDAAEDDERGEPVDVEFRRPQVELIAVPGDAAPAGYQILPLATVARSVRPGAAPEVLADVIPPLLAVDAWRPLIERLRGLSGLLHARARLLAKQLADRRLALDSGVPDELTRILKLQALNATDAHLRALTSVPRMAPWDVFLELCRIAGHVAIFAPDRLLDTLPEYRHEALGDSFGEVIRLIEVALAEEEAPPFDVEPFVKRDGQCLEVKLQALWVREGRPILLGVESDLDAYDCEQLLRSLDITIASRREVEGLHRRKLHGLDIRRAAAAPPGTPTAGRAVFFEFVEDARVWGDIAASQSMAIAVNHARIRFQDVRVVSAAATDGAEHDLTFALYVFHHRR